MNPIVTIINKSLILLNRLLDSIDRQTADTIKRVFFLIIFLAVVVSAFFGMKKGKESARIKHPPLAEYTNEVFNIQVMRQKKGGSFNYIIDNELMNEFKQRDPDKLQTPDQQRLNQSEDKTLIEPGRDVKIKRDPSVIFEDKLIDELNPNSGQKKDVRPLKKSQLPGNDDLFSSHFRGKDIEKKDFGKPGGDGILPGNEDKSTEKSYTSNLPLNIVKYEDNKNFFLTFDVGFDNEHINYILQTLRSHGVKATFFITGKFIKSFPDDVRNIIRDGHIVGNHTLTHSYRYTPKKLQYELKATEDLFEKVTGRKMLRIWRAPYLQHIGNKKILNAAREVGYQHIDASLVIMDDWIKNPGTVLSNNDFLKLFKSRLNFKNNKRIYVSQGNHKLFRPKQTSYQGVIMLIHTGRYRKGTKDFVYCLSDVITHLKNNGYYFDNCGRFSGPRF